MRVRIPDAKFIRQLKNDFIAGSCRSVTDRKTDRHHLEHVILRILVCGRLSAFDSPHKVTFWFWFWFVLFRFVLPNSDFICCSNCNASKFQHVSHFSSVFLLLSPSWCVFVLCFPRIIFWVVKKTKPKKQNTFQSRAVFICHSFVDPVLEIYKGWVSSFDFSIYPPVFLSVYIDLRDCKSYSLQNCYVGCCIS